MQRQSAELLVRDFVSLTEQYERNMVIAVRRNQTGETALYKQIRLASLKSAPYAFETTYDSALQCSDEMWHASVQSTAQGSDEAIFLAFSAHLPVGIAALVRRKGQTDTGELMQIWLALSTEGRILRQLDDISSSCFSLC